MQTILALSMIKMRATVMLLKSFWKVVARASSPALPDFGIPLSSIATVTVHLHGGDVRVTLSVQTMVLARMTLATTISTEAS